jgi:AcrR family transcriptional regulator
MRSRLQQGRDEQHRRILDGARELFGARNFDDVTMADVAERAGVARATVFNHFPGKHALVEAITEEVLSYWAGMLEHALADEKTATPALVRALFEHMGAGIAHYYRFYRGVFREIAKLQVGLEEGSGAARARATALERLTRLLARGQARGELRSDVEAIDLARAFDSLSNGTINQWLFDDTSGALEQRMERAVEIYLGAVVLGASEARVAAVVKLPAPPRARPRPVPRTRRSQ